MKLNLILSTLLVASTVATVNAKNLRGLKKKGRSGSRGGGGSGGGRSGSGGGDFQFNQFAASCNVAAGCIPLEDGGCNCGGNRVGPVGGYNVYRDGKLIDSVQQGQKPIDINKAEEKDASEEPVDAGKDGDKAKENGASEETVVATRCSKKLWAQCSDGSECVTGCCRQTGSLSSVGVCTRIDLPNYPTLVGEIDDQCARLNRLDPDQEDKPVGYDTQGCRSPKIEDYATRSDSDVVYCERSCDCKDPGVCMHKIDTNMYLCVNHETTNEKWGGWEELPY